MKRLHLSLLTAITAAPAGSQPFEIEQSTVAGGGGQVSAGFFMLRGVVNPQAGGRLEAGAFRLTGGLFPLDRLLNTDCPADTNGDGVLSPSDFNAWIIAFNNQSPACDQNGDGLCTPSDFNAWILNFNAGC